MKGALAARVVAIALSCALPPGCRASGGTASKSTSPRAEVASAVRDASSRGEVDRAGLMFALPRGAAALDLRYLRELEERGFDVDLVESPADLDGDRLRDVDVLVLSSTPDADAVQRGQPEDARRDEVFVGLVESFLADGGGVLLMPAETNLRKQRLAALYERWGARLPAEVIVEQDPARRAVLPGGSYGVQLAFTQNVGEGSLTHGVHGVWYPVHPVALSGLSAPLILDATWQPLLRGSSTSLTEAVKLPNSYDAASGLMQRSVAESAPTFFAVRTLGAGRVALTSLWPQFSIGSGTKMLYDRVVLERGVRGVRSDFGRLLENTLRWLAEPRSERRPRAARSASERVFDPNAGEAARNEFRSSEPLYDAEQLAQVAVPEGQRVYRGVIGARTLPVGGASAVAAHAVAARRAGIDFVVFLEPFEHLSPAYLQWLNDECKRLSGPDLLLLAGFVVRNNLGNRMFFFARQAVYPPAALLGGSDGKVFQVQFEHEGKFSGHATPYAEWAMTNYGRDALGQAGYFDFQGAPRGMRLPDARTYGAAGLRLYRDGRLIEDVLDPYLLTAAGTMAPAPFAIHELTSLAAFKTAVHAQVGLTYVVADNLDPRDWKGVLQRGLRWPAQYDASSAFVSSGPHVTVWPKTVRIFSYGAEGFAPARSLLRAPLLVESERGLREVAIYDGPRLFRRVALHGERSYAQTLVLDGSIQRNLIVVARDVRGGSATSSALRTWADGSLAPVFCGDRVNDCGRMRLARGSWWLRVSDAPAPPTFDAGDTWDGGPLAFVSALGGQYTLPILTFEEGGSQAAERLLSVPVLELADEEAVGVQSARTEGMYASEVAQVVNAWNTFGPATHTRSRISNVQRYREWSQPRYGAVPFGFAANGTRRGLSSSLFSNQIGFRRDTALESLHLASFERVEGATLLVANPATAPRHYLLSEAGTFSERVEAGGALALYGPPPLSAHVLVNRGSALSLRAAGKLEMLADGPNLRFRAGDRYTWELAGHAFPPGALGSEQEVLSFLEYLASPTGLELRRGTRLATAGVLELKADNGAVEVAARRVTGPRALPVRVTGLSPRVSAVLFQVDGYSPGFYGSGQGRVRSLAVDPEGAAYFPLYVDLSSVHVLAGHPVVVDGDGGEVFVQVTCLGGNPLRWHVSLNNPSGRALTIKIRKAMDLPGLALEERSLKLAPGELRVLQ